MSAVNKRIAVTGLLDLRNDSPDMNYDYLYLRKQRLEFYLLTSLGTRSMHKWIPQGTILTRGAKTIEIGNSSFVIKTHFRSNTPLLHKIREDNQELIKTLRQFK